MKDSIHNILLNTIKDKVPPGVNTASLLADVLHIGKEAAYRRLRGEVSFILEDVAAISKALDISIDDIIGQKDDIKSKPFQLKLTRHVDPGPGDYYQMEEFVNLLHAARGNSYREIGSSTNIFPQAIFLNFPYITKFYHLRWLYQWDGLENIKSLEDIIIPSKLADIHKRYIEESMYISQTYYIWDSQVFLYLLNDIRCFADINFISKEDVISLKEDLFKLIDGLENLANIGRYETGAKIQFYLSAINFESTYSYLQMDNFYLSQVKVFTLNDTVSLDEGVFNRLKKWIESLKRLSILISESGEIQRFQFFKEQRKLVNDIL